MRVVASPVFLARPCHAGIKHGSGNIDRKYNINENDINM